MDSEKEFSNNNPFPGKLSGKANITQNSTNSLESEISIINQANFSFIAQGKLQIDFEEQ